MHELVCTIQTLKKSELRVKIGKRMKELKGNLENEDDVFSELCFCLLTANERAAKGIEIQEKIGSGFLNFNESELKEFLKKSGYRFYNIRSKYVTLARVHHGKLREVLTNTNKKNDKEMREWLVKNVKGLGYKEASHFLRNIGFMDVAILDKHVLKVMHNHSLIDSLPKALNRKKYLEYEKKLEELCGLVGMKQGELDFYLWYLKTGKVLK
ncbi:N-glycosylase/DNA lyase [Candidatus Micrarchaeota archaeon]|nr:N-glycosylase/DNA lyase [Candidatus Micrarchaeota archaeon]